ncbi:unnamed protein product [Lactuca virosa]|uniref:Uncharacterized protein n=1 Tax=Lactuca virosa TaxID=75947 RepID=A0AAU9N7V2_9ASTR|nr:unnamed protein product [Lactuca virosa]
MTHHLPQPLPVRLKLLSPTTIKVPSDQTFIHFGTVESPGFILTLSLRKREFAGDQGGVWIDYHHTFKRMT